MKMNEKEFNKKVRAIRRIMPAWSNGRTVKVFGENTKAGQRLISIGSQYEGTDLRQIYDRWSDEKQKAFDECWEMYCNSRHGESFGICSHNGWGFTVSWIHDDGLTIVTPKTEYLIIFNE